MCDTSGKSVFGADMPEEVNPCETLKILRGGG